MRLAALVAAACLGLTGCATIKSWFEPTPPQARAGQPDEAAPRATPPPGTPASPRVTPPAPPRPAAPTAPADQPDEPAPRATPPPVTPAPPRVTVPAPPRPGAPTAPADVPPPVLSPVLSAADEQRLRADTQQRLDGTEQRLRQIDPAKLASAQQDSLRTVQSFLDKAREALQAKDIQRAFTLADKAYILADELSKRPR